MQHLSIYDIAELSGKSKTSLYRVPFLKEFEVTTISTGGRPMKFYKKEILELIKPERFGLDVKQETNKTRKHRTDHNLPREPKELSMEERVKLDRLICSQIRVDYITQALKDNVRESCRIVCNDYCNKNGIPKGWHSPEQMANYYYKARLMRKDGRNVGYYYSEHWEELWTVENNKRKLNSSMPFNRYDYISLFEDAGIAGQGFGVNALWAIDATQMDMWVKIDSKATTTKFLQIMDVLTGFPIVLKEIENESAELAIQALIEAVKKCGLPKYGLIVDNGRAFKSEAFQGFVNSLYTTEYLEELKTLKWHKELFSGQDGIIKFPLAKKPDYVGKAKLERSFDEMNRLFPTRYYPKNVLAGRESREVSYELGTTPTKAIKTAPNASEVWSKFQTWIYEEYITKSTTGCLTTFSKRYGLRPCKQSAWLYYGGLIDQQTLEVFVQESIKLMPPIENSPLMVYYRTPKEFKHIVKVTNYGSISFTHANEQYTFTSKEISFGMYGRKICVIPDPSTKEQVYLFLLNDPKHADARTPDADSIYFLGKGNNQMIDSLESLSKIRVRKEVQNHVMSDINSKLKQAKQIDTEENFVSAKIIDNQGNETKLLSVEVEQKSDKAQAPIVKKKLSYNF
jgi:hypothetical protein